MNIKLTPGKYVIAVSGGVDSVALLHIMSIDPRYKLVVAHYDHGIRGDSAEDRKLVGQLAHRYGHPFVYDNGQLGQNASEALARFYRYAFLTKVKQSSDAVAIVTAHHQDDLLETVVLNLVRGTNRRGISPLMRRPDVVRPLLGLPKAEIIDYAARNELMWREDSTNDSERYLRNYIRHRVITKLSADQRQQLLGLIHKQADVNLAIELVLDEILRRQSAKCQLDRLWFSRLGYAEAREVMAAWLRQSQLEFDRPAIERLTVAAKVMKPGKRIEITNGAHLLIGKKHLALPAIER